jgi:hypothetical protein
MSQALQTKNAEFHGDIAADVLDSGGAMQQIRSAYVTAVAVQKPRALPIVQRRLLDEARLAGEAFYYGWSAGKDRIEGPSVELAVAAARCWGNCAVEMQPVQETHDAWVFTGTFVDLETGFTMSRQFRQSKKWTVAGRMDDERKADVRFQIGQSKAQRNVILRSLPKYLIEQCMEEAKKGVRGKIEDLIKNKGKAGAVKLALGALLKCGVSEERVLKKLSVADSRGIDVEHLVILKGDLYALENGQDTADVLFPVAETSEGTAQATEGKMDELRQRLGQAQQPKEPEQGREPGIDPED